MRRLLTSLALFVVSSAIAGAAAAPDIAGDYVCKSGCRLTDAPPAIEIKGSVANCRSELGGIYTGTVLTRRSVACFKMVGTLSDDGNEILWSNGSVWQRR